MAVKYKKRKTSRRKSTSRRRHTRRKTQRRMRGGNYATDVTTQIYLGFPMKKSNQVVTSIPGRGVMSVSAYKQLMEDEERNGFDYYD